MTKKFVHTSLLITLTAMLLVYILFAFARSAYAMNGNGDHQTIEVNASVEGQAGNVRYGSGSLQVLYQYNYTLEFPSTSNSDNPSLNAKIIQKVQILDPGEYVEDQDSGNDINKTKFLIPEDKTYNLYFSGGKDGKFYASVDKKKIVGEIKPNKVPGYSIVMTGLDASPVYFNLPGDFSFDKK